MRALVVGIGAVGGWLLARLAQGGADVTGLARGETYTRLAAGAPVVLQSRHGDWSGPVRVVAEADGPYDVTFVCTKSEQTAEVGASLQRSGIAVSVQNGVDNPHTLAGLGGWERVVPSVVYSGCRRLEPTVFRHTSNGFLVLDDVEVAGWLNAHGVRADLVPDVRPRQWTKLAANVVQNSLTALLDSLQGPIRDHAALTRLRRDLIAEVAAVARAEGVDVGDDLPAVVLAGFERLPVGNGTSMLWDRRSGRPLEVDALTGAVVRRAARHGIDVPVTRTVDALVRFVSDSATGKVVQPAPTEPGGA